MKLSRLHWAGIVAVTAALVVMAPSDKDADIAKVARPAKQSSMRASSPSATEKSRTTEVGRVELERLAGLESQQIDKKEWVMRLISPLGMPPPAPRMTVKPVVVAPPPPPVPTAPPLPFTYLGRYGDTETRTIILSKGDRVYTVAVGEVIENTYRVEKFTPGVVHLTYLPLNIEQLLRTGETL